MKGISVTRAIAVVFACTGILAFGQVPPLLQEAAGQFTSHVMPGSETPGPPLVVLSGVLHPAEKAGGQSIQRVDMHVEDIKWSFEVKDAKSLSGTETRIELLEALHGRSLHLRGPDEVLRPIQNMQLAGEPVRIKGLFDSGGRTLDVKSFEKGNAASGKPSD
jgi:hypothetical protein